MKTFFNRVHKLYKTVIHGTTASESSLNHTLLKSFHAASLSLIKPYCSKMKQIMKHKTMVRTSDVKGTLRIDMVLIIVGHTDR